MSTGMICNCKQVSYADVENALHQMEKFDDVLSAFDEVQKITHCSTGCGGCHDKIMDAISEIMMVTDSHLPHRNREPTSAWHRRYWRAS